MTITSDRNHPGINKPRAPGDQNEAYLVLSEEERAKGFIRPVRDRYIHVGKEVCGKTRNNDERDRNGKLWVCTGAKGHEGPCFTWKAVSDAVARKTQSTHLLGCGTTTTMPQAIAETYARDNTFYGKTWCCGCNDHLPVGEFCWFDDGSVLGS